MFTPNDHTFALCAYGESPYLEECIKSVLGQTVKTNVLISTSTPNDHIVNLAKAYEVKLFVNEGSPSISKDWNCALAHCATPLVTVAHQDDVYLPGFSSALLQVFNDSKKPLISFSNYGELRDDKILESNKLLLIKRTLLKPLEARVFRSSIFVRRRILSFGSAICCPSVTFCTNNLPHPLFLNDMKCDLDWEAWERFSRLDGDYLYIPELLMLHRIHTESETTALIQDDTRNKEDLEMFKKFWPPFIAHLINKCYSRSMESNSL